MNIGGSKDSKWPDMPPPKCAKCGGEMKEGFVPEVAPGSGQIEVPRWVAGRPETGFFGGLKVGGKQQHLMRAFRCVNCGYVESYAL